METMKYSEEDINLLRKRAASVGLRTTILEPLSDETMQEAINAFGTEKSHNRPAVSRSDSGFTLGAVVQGSKMVNADPACAAVFKGSR